jgi:hypothetical protein
MSFWELQDVVNWTFSSQAPLPGAPSNLRVASSTSSEIDLAWNANSYNETGFRIERSTDGTTFTEIGTSTNTTFHDLGLPPGTYYYRVRAFNGAGNSPYSSTLQTGVAGPILTQDQDVGTPGDPAVPGSATFAGGGIYTDSGAGSDIWNQADGFHFVYKPLVGDGMITARVLSMSSIASTTFWAKAGVMIRETLAGNSRDAYVTMTPDGHNQVQFLDRAATGGNAADIGDATNIPFPIWVRVVRQGNTFTGFYSTNGTTFIQLGGPVTIAMAPTAYVGLVASSANNTTAPDLGGSNPGTLVNGATHAAGEVGNAFSFNGNGQYVDLPNATNIPVGNSPYTLLAWIKPNAAGNEGIIGYGNYGNNNQVNAFRLLDNGTGHLNLLNYWWANDLEADTNLPANSGAWHLAVAEFDGTTRRILLDSQVIAMDTPTGHNVQHCQLPHRLDQQRRVLQRPDRRGPGVQPGPDLGGDPVHLQRGHGGGGQGRAGERPVGDTHRWLHGHRVRWRRLRAADSSRLHRPGRRRGPGRLFGHHQLGRQQHAVRGDRLLQPGHRPVHRPGQSPLHPDGRRPDHGDAAPRHGRRRDGHRFGPGLRARAPLDRLPVPDGRWHSRQLYRHRAGRPGADALGLPRHGSLQQQ